jgi:hypothetical protein
VNPVGIEIEPRLVAEARSLAAVHGLEVCFVEGSYKPKEVFEPVASGLSVSVADEIGLFECDVIYVYTWPTERDSVTTALARFAVPGTIFMRLCRRCNLRGVSSGVSGMTQRVSHD